MTKDLLIKFIKGQASPDEEIRVLSWIQKNKGNEEYYFGLKNLWLSQNLSQQKATLQELERFKALADCRSQEHERIPRLVHQALLYRWSCVAVSILLIISAIWNILAFNEKEVVLQQEGNEVVTLGSLPDNRKNYFYTVKGAKARLELPDGSVVWLNSDSKITYPTRFEGPTREVYMSGEVLFEVIKNPEIPMVITTNKDFKIKVYGTLFNVRTYDNDNRAVATLYNGKIELITHNEKGEEKSVAMNPNEVYAIEDKTPDRPVKVSVEDITVESAWKDGKLIFDNTPIDQVIKSLERWHGTRFEIKDPAVLNYTVTAIFQSESIIQIMEMIKYCAQIEYSIGKDNQVILTCKK